MNPLREPKTWQALLDRAKAWPEEWEEDEPGQAAAEWLAVLLKGDRRPEIEALYPPGTLMPPIPLPYGKQASALTLALNHTNIDQLDWLLRHGQPLSSLEVTDPVSCCFRADSPRLFEWMEKQGLDMNTPFERNIPDGFGRMMRSGGVRHMPLWWWRSGKDLRFGHSAPHEAIPPEQFDQTHVGAWVNFAHSHLDTVETVRLLDRLSPSPAEVALLWTQAFSTVDNDLVALLLEAGLEPDKTFCEGGKSLMRRAAMLSLSGSDVPQRGSGECLAYLSWSPVLCEEFRQDWEAHPFPELLANVLDESLLFALERCNLNLLKKEKSRNLLSFWVGNRRDLLQHRPRENQFKFSIVGALDGLARLCPELLFQKGRFEKQSTVVAWFEARYGKFEELAEPYQAFMDRVPGYAAKCMEKTLPKAVAAPVSKRL
jgi:hypothetical protein